MYTLLLFSKSHCRYEKLSDYTHYIIVKMMFACYDLITSANVFGMVYYRCLVCYKSRGSRMKGHETSPRFV